MYIIPRKSVDTFCMLSDVHKTFESHKTVATKPNIISGEL